MTGPEARENWLNSVRRRYRDLVQQLAVNPRQDIFFRSGDYDVPQEGPIPFSRLHVSLNIFDMESDESGRCDASCEISLIDYKGDRKMTTYLEGGGDLVVSDEHDDMDVLSSAKHIERLLDWLELRIKHGELAPDEATAATLKTLEAPEEIIRREVQRLSGELALQGAPSARFHIYDEPFTTLEILNNTPSIRLATAWVGVKDKGVDDCSLRRTVVLQIQGGGINITNNLGYMSIDGATETPLPPTDFDRQALQEIARTACLALLSTDQADLVR